ncbi:hypothetical protein [Paludibaculum fermentans]|uniref:hypothetical protein n=1 Tax=Paludibaculum fermentans TaxID=1473598 RepID=UPI003EBAC237
MGFVSYEIGEGGLLDLPDAGADPGMIAAQGLDYVALLPADPEGGVGHDSIVDPEGFGPELAFELEEAALVATEHEAVDEEGPEAQIGDVRCILQRLAVEEVSDLLWEVMEFRIEVVAAGVLGDAALAFGRAGASRFLGVGAIGGESALGDGLLCHGGGARRSSSARFAPECCAGGAAGTPGMGVFYGRDGSAAERSIPSSLIRSRSSLHKSPWPGL